MECSTTNPVKLRTPLDPVSQTRANDRCGSGGGTWFEMICLGPDAGPALETGGPCVPLTARARPGPPAARSHAPPPTQKYTAPTCGMCIPCAARFRKLRSTARHSATVMSPTTLPTTPRPPAPASPLQNQSRLQGYPCMTSCSAPVTMRRLREEKCRWPVRKHISLPQLSCRSKCEWYASAPKSQYRSACAGSRPRAFAAAHRRRIKSTSRLGRHG